jgi:hypothetical protein
MYFFCPCNFSFIRSLWDNYVLVKSHSQFCFAVVAENQLNSCIICNGFLHRTKEKVILSKFYQVRGIRIQMNPLLSFSCGKS